MNSINIHVSDEEEGKGSDSSYGSSDESDESEEESDTEHIKVGNQNSKLTNEQHETDSNSSKMNYLKMNTEAKKMWEGK